MNVQNLNITVCENRIKVTYEDCKGNTSVDEFAVDITPDDKSFYSDCDKIDDMIQYFRRKRILLMSRTII